MKIDIQRCFRALKKIRILGRIDTQARLDLIEEAIRLIQKDGSTALKEEYLGIKNYANFGDQRSDHSYGYGHKHGCIVFRIFRANYFDAILGNDEIYLLECIRDNPHNVFIPQHNYNNLAEMLFIYEDMLNTKKEFEEIFERLEVDSMLEN